MTGLKSYSVQTIYGAAVNVLNNLLELFILTAACSGRQSLHSASRGDFVVPHARVSIKQYRDFSIVGPSAWNSLPSELRSLPRDLSSSFYKLLKTFIFALDWTGSTSE